MKTETEIVKEIFLLREAIKVRKELIVDPCVDGLERNQYRKEIKEIKNDIKMLEWVLE